MLRMRHLALLLTGSVLAALSFSATAQNAADAAIPTEKLVQKYATLAGSEDNARSLVTGLRNGSEIQLSGPGGAATFTPQTGKMGLGNVNIALALTEAQLAGTTNPAATDIQNALMNEQNGILALRARKMGWGEIAHSLGFKLGDLMRASAARDAQTARSERGQPQRLAGESRRPDFERAERFERPEKPERGGGRPERTMR